MIWPALIRWVERVWSEIGHGREDLGDDITFARVGFAVMCMAMVVMVMALRFCVSSVVFKVVLAELRVDHFGECALAGFDQRITFFMGDLDVAFAISINADYIFLLIVLD